MRLRRGRLYAGRAVAAERDPSAAGTVTFTVTVPAASASARRRRPAYVSTATQSVRIAVVPNGAAAVAACVATCRVSLLAPSGNGTFSVALYDGANATGNVLSAGSTQAVVVSGGSTALSVVLGGVVRSIALAMPASIPAGTPTSVPIAVTARDAQGRTIVGSDPFADASGNPVTITLSNVDTTANGSGKMTMTNAVMHTPADVPSLAYNGAAMTGTLVTAVVGGGAAQGLAGMSVVPGIAKVIPVHAADQLTFGGDGNLWYTGQFVPIVGRISVASGTNSEFTVPAYPDVLPGTGLMPITIVRAKNGSVWFNFEYYSQGPANDSGVGTIASDGTMTLYRDPHYINVFPMGLAAASDGTVWFGEANSTQVSRIAMDGTITSFALPSAGAGFESVSALTSGPDGNIWLGATYYLVRVALDGTATLFPTPYAHGDPNTYFPDSLATGPDGNVWYTENTQNGGLPKSKIATITMAGTITEYPIPSPHTARSIVAGLDGNMWFIDNAGVGSITTAGTVSYYALNGAGSGFSGLTVSPDGSFWLTGGANGVAPAVVEVVY